MKKPFFGHALMISGIIGSSAWLIARVMLVEPGAWSLAAISGYWYRGRNYDTV